MKKTVECTLRALALYALGHSYANISVILKRLKFKASKTTVANKITGVLSGSLFKPKSVRKTNIKLNARDLRHIRRCVRFFGDKSYEDVFQTFLQEGRRLSYPTIRRAVKKIKSIRFKKPRRRMLLTKKNKQERLEFAQRHLNAKTNWAPVWFSDQKWWGVDGPASRRPVLADKADPPPVLVQSSNRCEAVSVWAAISASKATDLMPLKV